MRHGILHRQLWPLEGLHACSALVVCVTSLSLSLLSISDGIYLSVAALMVYVGSTRWKRISGSNNSIYIFQIFVDCCSLSPQLFFYYFKLIVQWYLQQLTYILPVNIQRIHTRTTFCLSTSAYISQAQWKKSRELDINWTIPQSRIAPLRACINTRKSSRCNGASLAKTTGLYYRLHNIASYQSTLG